MFKNCSETVLEMFKNIYGTVAEHYMGQLYNLILWVNFFYNFFSKVDIRFVLEQFWNNP